MKLEANHEIIGTLYAVKTADNCCTLELSCNHELELPPAAIPEKKLASLVGKRVGIFNCDGEFFVRVFKGK